MPGATQFVVFIIYAYDVQKIDSETEKKNFKKWYRYKNRRQKPIFFVFGFKPCFGTEGKTALLYCREHKTKERHKEQYDVSCAPRR